MSNGEHDAPKRRDPRLASLNERLREAKARDDARKKQAEPAEGHGPALGLALRLATELAAGVGFGALIGWQLDRLFGTRPVLVIVVTILGVVGGMWNVIRTAERMHRQSGKR